LPLPKSPFNLTGAPSRIKIKNEDFVFRDSENYFFRDSENLKNSDEKLRSKPK